jgi:hypothetical protein
LPAERVLVDAHFEKAKTPEEKAAWSAIMEKISASFNDLMARSIPGFFPMKTAR